MALAGLLFDLLLQKLLDKDPSQLKMVLKQGQLYLEGLPPQLFKAGGRKQLSVGRGAIRSRFVAVRWIFRVGRCRLRAHKRFLSSVCDR